MRVLGIIQARVGSTRLPGKVLLPLAGGRSMLWHIARRAKRAKSLHGVVIATPATSGNENINSFELGTQVLYLKVAENDLIARFYMVANYKKADVIVRICADNPFIEPSEIDRAVEFYFKNPSVFVSNMHQHQSPPVLNGYPDGLGCEVFSMSRLRWMHEVVRSPLHREHPHLLFHDFSMVSSPKCPEEWAQPDLRLDVNTESDFIVVRDIYEACWQKNHEFTFTDVLEHLHAKVDLEKQQVPS